MAMPPAAKNTENGIGTAYSVLIQCRAFHWTMKFPRGVGWFRLPVAMGTGP
jgi:hypothetical protein